MNINVRKILANEIFPQQCCEVSNVSPPLMGWDEGEGENKFKNHPHPTPPPSMGREFLVNPEAELRGILLIRKYAKLRNGFTLLEVIIVIGIISLMVGILVPMVYRLWESQEIDTTKDRMTKLKEAMVGNISQINNGVRSNFGFVGDLGQLPPDLDALISYTNLNGTFGPYLSGGIDPQSFKKDAWGNNLLYSVGYTTDTIPRRESAIIQSLGSDNAVGGTGTAEDIQIIIDSNEVLPASSASCNVLVRYATAPTLTFSANITVHIAYKGGEGLEIEQSFISPVTITGYVGNSQNNYTYGMNSALTQKLPIGMARIWADINKDSSGNLLPTPAEGPPSYIAVNDRVSTVYANNLSISVP